MPTIKLTFLEELQLLTMHTVGFKREAREFAVKFGVSENYPAILHQRFFRPKLAGRWPYSKRWLRARPRAMAMGKIGGGHDDETTA